MSLVKRLGLAQRIVVVIAAALVLAAVGVYVTTLGWPGGFGGGTEYGVFLPRARTGSLRATGYSLSPVGPDLNPWQQLLVWIGLIGVWATASMVILKPSQRTEGTAEMPDPTA